MITVADRHETLATAIAASYMNIPLIHTQGGELTGSIDESVRHAITKLSHIHFPATKMAKKNDWGSIQDLYRRFLPLIVYEQHPGVAIRKELLKMRGAIRTARVRSPGAQGNASIQDTLDKLLQDAVPKQDLTRPIKI